MGKERGFAGSRVLKVEDTEKGELLLSDLNVGDGGKIGINSFIGVIYKVRFSLKLPLGQFLDQDDPSPRSPPHMHTYPIPLSPCIIISILVYTRF